MRIPDIIAAKRDGKELTSAEISSLVLGYANGDVPDYQMSAFLMAVYLRGLSFAETGALTRAIVDSGSVLDLSSIPGTKLDKHSTGGVGDKTTLVVVPMLAACGLNVPKMSGRGLGFTGGTLDKLESIPGFNTALSVDSFIEQVRTVGAAMSGQSADIVPADKKIYALRDVTATVESIPLIAASVMSKKIACGSDVIILDVKVGSGAFMKSLDHARELARMMMTIGNDFGRKTAALVTDMSQPLGQAVGNSLEVIEAIQILQGGGPRRLRDLCVELCAISLMEAEICEPLESCREMAAGVIDNGAALDKLIQIIGAQGGDVRCVDDPSLLPRASIIIPVKSDASGYVCRVDTENVGSAACILGAGRQRKEDAINPAAGLVVYKGLGEWVEKGEVIAELHTDTAGAADRAESILRRAYHLGEQVEEPPLIYDVLH